jgi:putative membrane protein
MMWDGHDGMGWWMLWGSFLWIIFVFAIVFVAARVATWGGGGTTESRAQGARPPGETPLDVARRRYAAGEISRDEFEQIKHDLG